MANDRNPDFRGGERFSGDRVKNADDPIVDRVALDRDSPDAGANEGEGNKSADRRYREGVARTVKSGGIEKKAKEAERALDSVYGDELREAEKAGLKRSRGEDPAVKKKR
jgi:hypothetical protein